MYLQRPPKNIPDVGLTEILQAMPDYCKVPNDPISGYRNYYINEKGIFCKMEKQGETIMVLDTSFTEIEVLKMDIAELTKQNYQSMIRIKRVN